MTAEELLPLIPAAHQGRIISLPGLLRRFGFALRADTATHPGKGFLGVRGQCLRNTEERKLLTTDTATKFFLGASWSFSHCLLAAEIAGRDLILL